MLSIHEIHNPDRFLILIPISISISIIIIVNRSFTFHFTSLAVKLVFIMYILEYIKSVVHSALLMN